MTSCKTRFAPSPTGLMHLGNARTALFSALLGNRFLLRIEDTDLERSTAEFVGNLLTDLHWMGLRWDEGPDSATPDAAYFQSCRSGIYDRYYEQLISAGQAYPCYCSPLELEVARKTQLSAGQAPRYSGRCGNLSAAEGQEKIDAGLKPTLRFRVPKDEIVTFHDEVRGPQKFACNDIGDFIIRRADGTPAFFFCNAVDDSLMGVDLVLRGEDHLSNTPRQLLILRALGLPQPRYAHISLILGDDGAPLSKRNGSRSIAELRDAGYLPLALLNMLARIGHHYESENILDFTELQSRFDIGHLGKSPSRFDIAHLKHWQEEAIRHADDATLRDWISTETWTLVPESRHTSFIDLVRRNCTFPADASVWAKILFSDDLALSADIQAVIDQASPSFFRYALAAAQEHEDFDGFMNAVKQTSGAKGKQLFMPLRAALTGRLDGPELPRIHDLLGLQRFQARLAAHADG